MELCTSGAKARIHNAAPVAGMEGPAPSKNHPLKPEPKHQYRQCQSAFIQGFRTSRKKLGVIAYIGFMKKLASRRHTTTKKASVLSSRESYNGPLFRVTTDHVLEPTGITVRRDVVRHSGSVVVLAVENSQSEPRVLLERQYRHAAERFLYELPAGRIDSGENELKAAKRELLEETGYSARSWKRILHFWASPGFVAEAMSLYLAQDLKPGAAQPEDDEVIEIKLVPLRQAVSMVISGKIQDAKTIAGVLWLDHHNRGCLDSE